MMELELRKQVEVTLVAKWVMQVDLEGKLVEAKVMQQWMMMLEVVEKQVVVALMI